MISQSRSGERGQTIVLVALSIVSLLAMAALAIDVVTLYTARSEVQRAADAAALAGAKAFVDSGATSDPANTSLQTLAQSMSTAFINAILAQNKVGGVPPVLFGSPAFDFATNSGNPRITVTLQRTGLPIFFARIWRRTPATVTASATAEAYNASNSQTNTGNLVRITPKCVKPLMVPNLNPNSSPPGLPYINVSSGLVAAGVVGEDPSGTTVWHDGCPAGGGSTCGPPVVPPPYPNGNYYFPAVVTANPANLCPSCSGTSIFEQSIECCDFNPYSCGGTAPNASVDLIIAGNTLRQDIHQGLQCSMNMPTQDTLDASNFPTGPMEITAHSGPQSGKLVTTSSSIVTLPIFNNTTLNPATGQVTIIGFLQAFLWDFNGSSGIMQMTTLNVVGCGNNPGSTTAVTGGGVTPIPVRLIRN
jgi:Flp pilus assembly protein TadG